MRPKGARPDELVAEIATRQHGVITIEQLLWAGLTHSAIKRRIQAGHLHRLYRGVYAVGHRNLTLEGHWMGAVQACGGSALLGFESAGVLWKMIPAPTRPFPPVHVLAPGYSGRPKRQGITLHRTATLSPGDITRRRNIPVTSPARTRRDLGFGQEPTRSRLERAFLGLVRDAGLAQPEVNDFIGPYRVDFLWRKRRVIVETDSYGFHSSRRSFEADRARDRELQLRGFVVLRFTYREVLDEAQAVASALRAHLAGVRGRSARRG